MTNLPCTYCPFASLAVGGFSIMLLYILKYQERFLYLPTALGNRKTSMNQSPYQNPGQFGLKYEEIWLKTPDNLNLHSWWIPYLAEDESQSQCNEDTNTCNNIPTILFFHANAGSMCFCIYKYYT